MWTADAKPKRKDGLFRRVLRDPSEWSVGITVAVVIFSMVVGIVLLGLPGALALYPAQILLDAPPIDSLDADVVWPLALLMSLIWPVGFGVARVGNSADKTWCMETHRIRGGFPRLGHGVGTDPDLISSCRFLGLSS